eukprot:Blabericola_migrator_1__2619@NODE_173_length_12074_cov_75_040476_g150_i0_p8_GENE_NODE_173_length_12074_cov_75_040476_g150_i0NODE_173_length_12074_cov_75_040476_g150_i0_p8_ORF_typecomplete_len174_score23_21Fer2/PF00111_27/3_9e11_NODE_173_length_12074_cov_75_040476_g150_i01052211043
MGVLTTAHRTPFRKPPLPTWCARPVSWVASRHTAPAATASVRFHGSHVDREKEKTLTITFVDKQGQRRDIRTWHGENVLEVAHENDIEVEGACEGSLACSTCHVILETQEMYDKFKPPSEREEDLLDCAPGLSDTSRLCCQLKLDANKHNGVVFKLPKLTRNFYVDGHVPKPH